MIIDFLLIHYTHACHVWKIGEILSTLGTAIDIKFPTKASFIEHNRASIFWKLIASPPRMKFSETLCRILFLPYQTTPMLYSAHFSFCRFWSKPLLQSSCFYCTGILHKAPFPCYKSFIYWSWSRPNHFPPTDSISCAWIWMARRNFNDCCT